SRIRRGVSVTIGPRAATGPKRGDRAVLRRLQPCGKLSPSSGQSFLAPSVRAQARILRTRGTVGAGKVRPPVPLSRLLGFTRLTLLAALLAAPASVHAQAQATTGVIR